MGNRSFFVLLLLHTTSSNPQIYSLDIGFGSDGASVTRFPNPVAPTQHRFEAAAQTPPSAFAPQPVRVAAGSGGGEEAGKQQARHDEALRQNALHRQMLAEVEEKHRAAAVQAAETRGHLLGTGRADFYGEAARLPGDGSISDSGKVDIFLKKKKKCDQPPKKKNLLLKSKVADRKELVEHLRLVAKLETEVNRLFLRSLRLEAGLQKDEEQESFGAVRRRPNLADPRKKA